MTEYHHLVIFWCRSLWYCVDISLVKHQAYYVALLTCMCKRF